MPHLWTELSAISDREAGREQLVPELGGERRFQHRAGKEIPPLRGPTRHNSVRKKKSGRSGRDDRFWSIHFEGSCMSELKLRPPKEEEGTPRPTLAKTKPARMGHPAEPTPRPSLAKTKPARMGHPASGESYQRPATSDQKARVKRSPARDSPPAARHFRYLLCYVAVHSLAPSVSCGVAPTEAPQIFMERPFQP